MDSGAADTFFSYPPFRADAPRPGLPTFIRRDPVPPFPDEKMARPVERFLFAVTLAGLLAAAIVLWTPVRRSAPVRPVPAAAPEPAAAVPAAAPAAPFVSAPLASASSGPPPGAAAGGAPGGDAPEGAFPAPTASPAPSDGEGTPAASAAVSSAGAEAAVRCAPVEELWEADGLPVEDLCTLEEVERVLRWAWTGDNEQRRAAIRNGRLLGEVFGALDRFGREHGAFLFHPEERGRYEVLLDDIRWQGGPDHEAAVIGVVYRFEHPFLDVSESFLDTLVQVDGEWKLSYRRSFCVKVMVIMEYVGSSVRCPRDPHPEVNEDESPGSTGRYY